MRKLPNKCINLIIADPPYNIGKDYGNKTDKQSREEYIEFIKIFMEQSERILKESGSLILYTGKQYYPYYYIAIKECMNIQNSIIWSYDSSGVQAKTKYGGLYEYNRNQHYT